MAEHLLPLVVVELAGLVEDSVGDAELADVVQQRGAAEVAPHRGPSPSTSAIETAMRRRPRSGSHLAGNWRRWCRPNAYGDPVEPLAVGVLDANCSSKAPITGDCGS